MKKSNKQNKRVQKTEKRKKRRLSKTNSQSVSIRPRLSEMVDDALELIDNGDLKEGAQILKKLKGKYNSPFVFFGLGVLSFKREKHDDAISYFKQTVELAPEFIGAHVNLASLYRIKINILGMVESYEKVIEFGSSDDEYVDLAKKELVSFEKNLLTKKGVSLENFKKGHRFFDAALAYMGTGAWEDAISLLKKSIDLDPNQVQSYGNIGICYAKIGQIQRGIEALDKALELDPFYELALANRMKIELLSEGDRCEDELRIVDYALEYPMQNRSYIQELEEETKRVKFAKESEWVDY